MPRFIATLILPLLVAGGAGADDDLDALNAQLQNITSVSADFDLISLDPEGAAANERSGRLQFARPNYLRWQVYPPFEQLIVSDGELFYDYDPDLEQVVIQRLEQDLQQAPILLLAGDREEIAASYSVQRLALTDPGSTLFRLTPRDPSRLIALVELRFSAQHLLSLRVYDSQGHSSLLLLNDSRENVAIDPANFIFTPPAGVDVLRYDD